MVEKGYWTEPTVGAAAERAPDGVKTNGTGVRRHAPISVALGFVLGTLVMLAVASVMSVGIWSGYQNTVQLMREKADILLAAAERQTKTYLDGAAGRIDFLAELIRVGEAEPGPNESFTKLLFGTLASASQILAIAYISSDENLIGAERTADGPLPIYARIGEDDALRGALAHARETGTPRWGAILWREEYGEPVLTFAQPVRVDGRFAGVLVAMISARHLSEFVSDLDGQIGDNAFILYGRQHILAHPLMAFGYPGLNALEPLPRVAGFGDPVVASMWESHEQPFFAEAMFAGKRGHAIGLGDEAYAFLYREMDGYSDRPLIVGGYFRVSDLTVEIARLKWALVACLVILVLAVAVAAFTGRRIALPVRRLAAGARMVHNLDIANVPRIPGSFLSEIDEASNSFNTMLDGLRWFERYVPKPLVSQLVGMNEEDSLASTERVATVMFTDIVGFTRLSEKMSPADIALLLNNHFSLVTRAIEAEGGIVDKYIGDSVMAIWGAPEQTPDDADRACRAAMAIKNAISADNQARILRGETPLAVRVAIHTGPVVVGNIGSPDRINYTVVGDTVNCAQRLDDVGKRLVQDDTAVNVVVSGDTVASLRDHHELAYVGPQLVRGRDRGLEVYALGAGGDAQAAA